MGIAAIVYSALQLFRESLIALEVIEEQFAALQESLHERARDERKNRSTHWHERIDEEILKDDPFC